MSRQVSLALGSGSAKGLVHIGVIDVLLENGYEITAISGTSAGAIVAAFYALDKMDELKDWMLSFAKKDTLKMLDISLLSGGLISGKNIMKLIRDRIGDAKFEDTRIPLYINATNMSTGYHEIFRKGELLPAIRASK